MLCRVKRLQRRQRRYGESTVGMVLWSENGISGSGFRKGGKSKQTWLVLKRAGSSTGKGKATASTREK